jgi:hypothetical protein
MMRLGIAAIALLALALGAFELRVQAYSWEEAARESYWYSLYNVQALLDSGLGLLGDGRLIIPYASGDPTYVQTGSREWSPAKADKTITTQGLAWTAIALLGHAKQLAQLYEAGVVSGDEATQAIELGVRAAQMLQFVYEKLRDPATGLYRPRLRPKGSPVGEPTPLDQAVTLWAHAELLPLTTSPLYRGEISRPEAERRSVQLFWSIRAYESANPSWLDLSGREAALFLEALSAYAATLLEGPELTQAMKLIHERAYALAEEPSQDASLRDQAAVMRALIVIARLLGDEALRQRALAVWEAMQALWNEQAGAYRSAPDALSYEYSVWDVGDLVGAFGAAIYDLGLVEARVRYAQLFEGVIKKARLMIAEGLEAGGSADNDPVPAPEDAGGRYGRAPAFASKVQLDPALGDWVVTNSRFTTAGAMYLAARLLWLGAREGWPYLGPPRFGLPISATVQLLGLRQQLAKLQSERVPPERVEALKELFMALEARVQELNEQTKAWAQMQKDLQQLSQELAQLGSDLSAQRTELEALKGQIRILNGELSELQRTQQRDRWIGLTVGLALLALWLITWLVVGRRLRALALAQASQDHVDRGVEQHDAEEPS